jgi:hypothetical protein
MTQGESTSEAGAAGLLERLRRFCFPAGPEAARRIRAVRVAEHGEMRSAPNARWMEFTAKMEISAAPSGFRWEAQMRGGMGWFGVTDAYEAGHGWLAIRVGGVAVKKMAGLDFDRGELQRYLASLALCPPMLLNHPSLEWTVGGPGTLWLRDGMDRAGAAVAMDIGDDGCPIGGHGLRPRALGKRNVETPWRVAAGEFRECEGLRIPARTEAWWEPGMDPFQYYRSEISSFTAVR